MIQSDDVSRMRACRAGNASPKFVLSYFLE
jgi:hypothetical protein